MGIFDDYGEFVPTQAAAKLVIGHDQLQPPSDLSQQAVAYRMPQCIVDGLETIEVDHQEPTATPPFVGIDKCLGQRLG